MKALLDILILASVATLALGSGNDEVHYFLSFFLSLTLTLSPILPSSLSFLSLPFCLLSLPISLSFLSFQCVTEVSRMFIKNGDQTVIYPVKDYRGKCIRIEDA